MIFSEIYIILLAAVLYKATALPTNDLAERQSNKNLISLITSASTKQFVDCHSYFESRLNNITDANKRNHVSCIHASGEAYAQAEAATLKNRKDLVYAAQQACRTLKQCSKIKSAEGVFECFAREGSNNMEIMYYISRNASVHLSELKEEYRLIKYREDNCINKFKRLGEEEYLKAYENFEKCKSSKIDLQIEDTSKLNELTDQADSSGESDVADSTTGSEEMTDDEVTLVNTKITNNPKSTEKIELGTETSYETTETSEKAKIPEKTIQGAFGTTEKPEISEIEANKLLETQNATAQVPKENRSTEKLKVSDSSGHPKKTTVVPADTATAEQPIYTKNNELQGIETKPTYETPEIAKNLENTTGTTVGITEKRKITESEKIKTLENRFAATEGLNIIESSAESRVSATTERMIEHPVEIEITEKTVHPQSTGKQDLGTESTYETTETTEGAKHSEKTTETPIAITEKRKITESETVKKTENQIAATEGLKNIEINEESTASTSSERMTEHPIELETPEPTVYPQSTEKQELGTELTYETTETTEGAKHPEIKTENPVETTEKHKITESETVKTTENRITATEGFNKIEINEESKVSANTERMMEHPVEIETTEKTVYPQSIEKQELGTEATHKIIETSEGIKILEKTTENPIEDREHHKITESEKTKKLENHFSGTEGLHNIKSTEESTASVSTEKTTGHHEEMETTEHVVYPKSTENQEHGTEATHKVTETSEGNKILEKTTENPVEDREKHKITESETTKTLETHFSGTEGLNNIESRKESKVSATTERMIETTERTVYPQSTEKQELGTESTYATPETTEGAKSPEKTTETPIEITEKRKITESETTETTETPITPTEGFNKTEINEESTASVSIEKTTEQPVEIETTEQTVYLQSTENHEVGTASTYETTETTEGDKHPEKTTETPIELTEKRKLAESETVKTTENLITATEDLNKIESSTDSKVFVSTEKMTEHPEVIETKEPTVYPQSTEKQELGTELTYETTKTTEGAKHPEIKTENPVETTEKHKITESEAIRTLENRFSETQGLNSIESNEESKASVSTEKTTEHPEEIERTEHVVHPKSTENQDLVTEATHKITEASEETKILEKTTENPVEDREKHKITESETTKTLENRFPRTEGLNDIESSKESKVSATSERMIEHPVEIDTTEPTVYPKSTEKQELGTESTYEATKTTEEAKHPEIKTENPVETTEKHKISESEAIRTLENRFSETQGLNSIESNEESKASVSTEKTTEHPEEIETTEHVVYPKSTENQELGTEATHKITEASEGTKILEKTTENPVEDREKHKIAESETTKTLETHFSGTEGLNNIESSKESKVSATTERMIEHPVEIETTEPTVYPQSTEKQELGTELTYETTEGAKYPEIKTENPVETTEKHKITESEAIKTLENHLSGSEGLNNIESNEESKASVSTEKTTEHPEDIATTEHIVYPKSTAKQELGTESTYAAPETTEGAKYTEKKTENPIEITQKRKIAKTEPAKITENQFAAIEGLNRIESSEESKVSASTERMTELETTEHVVYPKIKEKQKLGTESIYVTTETTKGANHPEKTTETPIEFTEKGKITESEKIKPTKNYIAATEGINNIESSEKSKVSMSTDRISEHSVEIQTTEQIVYPPGTEKQELGTESAYETTETTEGAKRPEKTTETPIELTEKHKLAESETVKTTENLITATEDLNKIESSTDSKVFVSTEKMTEHPEVIETKEPTVYPQSTEKQELGTELTYETTETTEGAKHLEIKTENQVETTEKHKITESEAIRTLENRYSETQGLTNIESNEESKASVSTEKTTEHPEEIETTEHVVYPKSTENQDLVTEATHKITEASEETKILEKTTENPVKDKEKHKITESETTKTLENRFPRTEGLNDIESSKESKVSATSERMIEHPVEIDTTEPTVYPKSTEKQEIGTESTYEATKTTEEAKHPEIKTENPVENTEKHKITESEAIKTLENRLSGSEGLNNIESNEESKASVSTEKTTEHHEEIETTEYVAYPKSTEKQELGSELTYATPETTEGAKSPEKTTETPIEITEKRKITESETIETTETPITPTEGFNKTEINEESTASASTEKTTEQPVEIETTEPTVYLQSTENNELRTESTYETTETPAGAKHQEKIAETPVEMIEKHNITESETTKTLENRFPAAEGLNKIESSEESKISVSTERMTEHPVEIQTTEKTFYPKTTETRELGTESPYETTEIHERAKSLEKTVETPVDIIENRKITKTETAKTTEDRIAATEGPNKIGSSKESKVSVSPVQMTEHPVEIKTTEQTVYPQSTETQESTKPLEGAKISEKETESAVAVAENRKITEIEKIKTLDTANAKRGAYRDTKTFVVNEATAEALTSGNLKSTHYLNEASSKAVTSESPLATEAFTIKSLIWPQWLSNPESPDGEEKQLKERRSLWHRVHSLLNKELDEY